MRVPKVASSPSLQRKRRRVEIPLMETARMKVGTKLCDKVRHVVVNMAAAAEVWNCKLVRLGLQPLPTPVFISSVLDVSINTVYSVLAQARPKSERGMEKHLLPACKYPRKPMTRIEIWEDYAARFDPVVPDTVRDIINHLHRASTPVAVEKLRQCLNKCFEDCECWPVNGIGERGLRKLLLGLGYRYRLYVTQLSDY